MWFEVTILLEEFAQPKGGDLQLVRRIWFDRVGEIRLARMQTFDERGLMLADVAYLDEKPTGPDGRQASFAHRHYAASRTVPPKHRLSGPGFGRSWS